VLPAMFSIALLGIAVVIVAEGGLAIIGAGVKPEVVTWGNVIVSGQDFLREAPHIVLSVSIVIFLSVLALNFLGDVVRARFDVRESAL
jgi:peptide/nickel transport system permease protein